MKHIKRMTTAIQSVVSVLLSVFLFVHHVSGMALVEGYDGGSVVLPCNITPNGDLTWIRGPNLILVKQASGAVLIQEGLWKEDVSLVNGADLRISPVRRGRDGAGGGYDKVFECAYTGGGTQQIQLRLLVRIESVSILEASNGRVTVTAGTPTTLNCSATGDPDPPPTFRWSVYCVINNGQTSISCTFTPDKSIRVFKCTATNRYSDGSVLSVKEVTATLNVLYLDTPSAPALSHFTENSTATLQCLAKGNPQPNFEWRNSTNVLSQSADYTIENVQRSAAGEYTCRVYNSVTIYDVKTNLIVQYAPDVTVSYDKIIQTLSCTADAVPRNYTFSPWEHRLDGKLLQTLGTQSSGSTATLKLPGTLTYEDTGFYVCKVSNGIKTPQRGHILVTSPSPAIFENQSLLLTLTEGQTGSISVPFYTNSDTPNVTVVWKKSGESTVLTSHREGTGPVRLMIRGQNVSIEGTVTGLTLRDVTQSDEGNYTVNVTNDINGVPQSTHISLSVYVTSPSANEPVNRDVSDGNVKVGAAVGGGIAAVVVGIIIAIVVVVLFRKYRMKSEETVRNPAGQTAVTFRNVQQEGTVYQGLAINPDYVNTTENQPYATLAGKGQEATDYEQCDVPVNETNYVVADPVPHAAQYEDVSFSIQGGIPEYTDICPESTDNIEYENKALEKENAGTYYNL